MLTIADILEALTHIRPANANAVITEAAIDSRQVIPGSLFIAIPGEKADGHDFLTDAFKRGASFALIQRDVPASFRVLDLRDGLSAGSTPDLSTPLCLRVDNSIAALQQAARFWRRQLDLRVIGITGSVGKSTTKEAIYDVLSVKYHTLKTPGNLNNEIGLPLTVLKLGSGYQRAVLEMGFYVLGEIEFLCDIAMPHIGVVSNVGTVHAERAGSQEIIAQGKGELIAALPEDGVAILNFDDLNVRKMEERAKSRVFFYGLTPEADLWADQIEGIGLEGIRFRLHHKKETLHVRIPMIGRHSVHTALRAAAVGINDGMSWEEILEGLSQTHSQLRMVAVRSASGALILDDTYNASPESMLAGLNLLSEMDGNRIAVLGDMLELGQYEKQGHDMVGMRAAQVARTLLTLGPRAHMIADAARRAGMKSSAIHEFEDINLITDWLRQNLKEHDAVLIKGSHGLRMDRITAALEVRS